MDMQFVLVRGYMKNIVTFSFMSADVNAASSTINCNKTRSIIEEMLSGYFDRGRNSIGMHSTELSQCYGLYLGLHGHSNLNKATELMIHSSTQTSTLFNICIQLRVLPFWNFGGHSHHHWLKKSS